MCTNGGSKLGQGLVDLEMEIWLSSAHALQRHASKKMLQLLYSYSSTTRELCKFTSKFFIK